MLTQVYEGDDLARYGFGEGHPFGPDRLTAFWHEAVRQGIDKRVHVATPASCSEHDILRFHSEAYLERVKQQSESGAGYLDYGDTPAFKGVYEAAAFVVGSGLASLECLMSGEHPRTFVPIAGLHHARRDSAAGFCVFNDPGVLIETLRGRHGLRRIAYVDIDAHHGDGVFYAYEDDPDLIFVDIHEDGRFLYPGTGFAHETGKGAAKDTKMNVPVLPGAGDEVFQAVWPRVEEFLRASQPQVILLQAGADSIKGDPITHMQFTPAAHAHATARLCAIADEYCEGRIVAMGGGGYNRTNLALAWSAVVTAMLEST